MSLTVWRFFFSKVLQSAQAIKLIMSAVKMYNPLWNLMWETLESVGHSCGCAKVTCLKPVCSRATAVNWWASKALCGWAFRHHLTRWKREELLFFCEVHFHGSRSQLHIEVLNKWDPFLKVLEKQTCRKYAIPDNSVVLFQKHISFFYLN